MTNQTPNTTDRAEQLVTSKLEKIATRNLGVETLEERDHAELDYLERHVTFVRDALLAAYVAGVAAGHAAPRLTTITTLTLTAAREQLAATTITRIAACHLGLKTLAERNRDALDFHRRHVSCLKAALHGAYGAGHTAGRADTRPWG